MPVRLAKVMLAAIVVSTAALPGNAQMPIAGPADLVAALDACRTATGSGGLDATKLTGAGWALATASKDGQPIDMDVQVFGKPGVKAILLAGPDNEAKPLCTAMARIPDLAMVKATVAALDTALAVPRKSEPGDPTSAYWFPQSHLVWLQITGTSKKPGLRIAVMYRSEEKK